MIILVMEWRTMKVSIVFYGLLSKTFWCGCSHARLFFLRLLLCLTGNPSEENCYADIEAAYKFLRSDLNVPSKNIVLYGRSLGSGPSCYMASGTAESEDLSLGGGPVGGVILHAPFLSVYRIVVETGCTVYGDKFPNIDYAPMIQSPVLFVHGTADQIVPFNHSERLYDALPPKSRAKPLFIEGMGHNNVHSVVRPMFVARLNEYLEEHVWPNIRQPKLVDASYYGCESHPVEVEEECGSDNDRYASSQAVGFTRRRR
jgi:dienelactone hydrolase